MNIYARKRGVNNCLKQSLVAIEIQFIVDNIKDTKQVIIEIRELKKYLVLFDDRETQSEFSSKKNYRTCTDLWKLAWQRNQEGTLKIRRIKFKYKYSISKLTVTSDSSS